MKERYRIIVTGLIAQYPIGGVSWDYVQYVIGLHKLGHEVYYIEDTGQWPYNPIEGGVSARCDFNVNYLSKLMKRFELGENWAYRFPEQSQWFGLLDTRREDVIRSADLLINISGSLARPEEYRRVRRMAFIDSDPVFTQVKLARGQMDFLRVVDTHDIHFTFGERLSEHVPDTGHHWRPTRQPIVLSEWRPAEESRESFTTVMNWTSYKPIVHAGISYGQKDVEFRHFLELPSRVPDTRLELAINAGKTRRTPREMLAHKGWVVVDPDRVCPDMDSYRDYIRSSKAEWSVAKNGYVVGQPGWFSCRSACYLAAGRPVVVQDTGFSDVLPVGRGILPFTDVETAVEAIREVEADYRRNSAAAREIAHQAFDSDIILSHLIDEALGTNGT